MKSPQMLTSSTVGIIRRHDLSLPKKEVIPMATETGNFVVERHSIDYIPESERHGSPLSLFTLWFSANMQITTVVTGALAVVLGLPLIWALVAIVVGNILGGIFMALHSAQGPTLGIPQMIQSRAQFGFYGAILPLVLVILIILGIIAANVLNLYGIFLTTTTTIAALQRFRTSLSTRLGFVLGAAIVGTAVAVLGQGNFIANYTNFLLLLLYFVIPWSAINLVDFYLLRREQYDINSIFDPNGIYGRVNWRAILAYVVAILLELPFISTTLFTGPLVAYLGGADIAWIVGLAAAGILYYALMRTRVVAVRA